jgi:hypothetical protein
LLSINGHARGGGRLMASTAFDDLRSLPLSDLMVFILGVLKKKAAPQPHKINLLSPLGEWRVINYCYCTLQGAY